MWVFLDSQSTVLVFKNRHYLSNIWKSTTKLVVHTNSGRQFSLHIGTVENFGDVWYNPKLLANILSMAAVRKVCRITMDTSVKLSMNLHHTNSSIMKFLEYSSGLYYFDASQNSPNTSSSIVEAYIFLNTVAGNKERFTRYKIEGADRARDLYRKLGHPSEQQFMDILTRDLI